MEEKRTGFGMRGDTLQQGQGVADAIGGRSGESRSWRHEQGVDRDNFLQQSGCDAEGVPEIGCELLERFAFFAQFEECPFASCRNGNFDNELFHRADGGASWLESTRGDASRFNVGTFGLLWQRRGKGIQPTGGADSTPWSLKIHSRRRNS